MLLRCSGVGGTVLAVVSGGQSDVEFRASGRLTDYVALGVLSARFHRDLLEQVINQTGVSGESAVVACRRT